jgi:hypothetical protein
LMISCPCAASSRPFLAIAMVCDSDSATILSESMFDAVCCMLVRNWAKCQSYL